MMQVELQKLYLWGKKNNMEFNSTKFQVIRYGRNTELKENTEYFTGDFEEIIERFSSLRDVGVQMSEDANFTEHIDNICEKVRQRCGRDEAYV